MATAQVCPIVGTTNNILPPQHPTVDLDKPGQICPITNATTDHHHTLAAHPNVPGSSNDASKCPALKDVVKEDQSKKMDDVVCPVVGPVTSVLPPDHPSIEGASKDTCPVTLATLSHHKDKVISHPPVHIDNKSEKAQCPVVGATA